VWCWVDSLTSLSRERVRQVSDTELLHKSKGEPFRRLEVFTGSGRRRAWSAEQKARILTESYESGDEVSAVARRHGLTPQQLFGWRRDVRRRSTRRQSNDAAEKSFAPVLVETRGPHAGPPVAPSCPTATGTIEIALGAAVVRVGPGTDLADADEGAAGGEGRDVISVPAGVRVLVATKPVDFRRGADSLAALAKDELQRDPFSGTILVFRSKRADRLKILAWDGSGLILYWKRLEEGAFRWPPISDGVMRLSASQLAALVDGLDWSRLHARDIAAPEAAS
jgi:transposase